MISRPLSTGGAAGGKRRAGTSAWLAAAVVGAAIVAAVLWLSGGRKAECDDNTVQEVKAPPAAPSAAPGKRPPVRVHAAPKPEEPELLPGETPEMAKIRVEDPARYAAITNREAVNREALEKIGREPVKGLAEQLLMMAFPSERGDIVPPMPIPAGMDEELEKAAQKMLERVVDVEDHDTEESLLTKERLLQLREEWADAKARGESFGDFLRNRQAKANNDAEHFQDAMALDKEYYNDANLSDAEYLESRRKINNLLNVEGFKPLPVLEEEHEAMLEEADAKLKEQKAKQDAAAR